MSYGHAERTLAMIRLLQAETVDFLSREHDLDDEHERWLRAPLSQPHGCCGLRLADPDL